MKNRTTPFYVILFLILIYSGNVFAQIPSTNLKLYVKADSGITESSGKVSVWADGSGKGNNLFQNTIDRQPSLITNSLNGHPVIRFNGADVLFLNLPTAATLGIQNSDYEIFIVARNNVASSPVLFLIGGDIKL